MTTPGAGEPVDERAEEPFETAAGSPLREIARSGLLAVLLHPLGSAVTVACVVAMLAPFLVGLGISRGVTEQTAASIDLGPDIHVAASRYGRPAPVPLAVGGILAKVPGVTGVEPRIVGATVLGSERVPVVVVGVADARLAEGSDGAGVTLVDGRLPHPGGAAEVAIGSDLATRLGLKPGSMIPPFYRNDRGERATLVTGVFRSDLPAWQGRVMLTSFTFASAIFEEEDTASGFLVRCPAEYRAAARVAIQRLAVVPQTTPGAPPIRLRVVTKDDLAVLLERRALGREGGLALLWALVFAVGVPLVLATTGLGLSERRRETALLRAIGWRTDEVLLRSLCESLALAVAGAALSLVAAWAWVRVFRGAGIAQVFMPDGGPLPGHEVPFRLAPEVLIAAVVISLVVTTAGSLWSSWRAASAPPTEALR